MTKKTPVSQPRGRPKEKIKRVYMNLFIDPKVKTVIEVQAKSEKSSRGKIVEARFRQLGG